MASSTILTPSGVALTPPFLGPERPGGAGPDPKTPPVVLLGLGFGRLGFASVRQAHQEAESLLGGLRATHNSWGGLATVLSHVAQRRWADVRDDDTLRAGGLRVSGLGASTIERRDGSDVMAAALAAVGLPPATLALDTHEHDWSPLNGPLLALARSDLGDYAVFWLDVLASEAATPPVLAQFAGESGALIVACDCRTPGLVERSAEQLSDSLETPTELGRLVQQTAAILRADIQHTANFAILVLSNSGVMATSSGNFVYGIAGKVTATTVDADGTEIDSEETAENENDVAETGPLATDTPTLSQLKLGGADAGAAPPPAAIRRAEVTRDDSMTDMVTQAPRPAAGVAPSATAIESPPVWVPATGRSERADDFEPSAEVKP
jgi:hypothetical protein